MNNYQRCLIITLTFFIIISDKEQAFAQAIPTYSSISGKLIDSLSKQPARLATINIINQANETIKKGISDRNGFFMLNQIPKGNYTLQIITVGYRSKTITLKSIDTLKHHIDVGVVEIQADYRQLKGVEVTASKRLVKQEIDRLVYDVQSDPDSKGNSVLEIMSKVPFVSLDAEQNILLKNNASFKIFINGKPSAMVENNPKEVLRSMPASTIAKIEVITTPPAKYDAEGFTGIINIITNRRPSDGYNGTLNLNESLPAGGPGMGGTFNFKAGKLVTSVFTGGALSKTPGTNGSLYRNVTGSDPTTLTQGGDRKSDVRTGYLGTDVSYEINSVQLISAQVNLNRNSANEREIQQSTLIRNGAPLQAYHLQNDYNGDDSNIDASLNYQLGFKARKGKMVTFSYRYANYATENSNMLNLNKIINSPFSDFRQENKAGSNEHTLQADFVSKFENWELESGIKTIWRNNSSNFNYTASSILSNNFYLSQDVYSIYTSVAYTGKSWGLKSGVRAEQTLIDGDISRNYLNIVPSVSIALQLSEGNSLNFGYSQRLRRAGINRLNPFTDRSNPNSEFSGNPNLNASSINNILIGYNCNGKLSMNIGLGYSFFNNLDFRIFAYDATTGITRSTYANVGEGAALTADLYLNYGVTKNLSFKFNGNVTFLNVEPKGNLVPATNGVYYNFTVSGGYRLLPSWRLAANMNVVGKAPASKSFQAINKGQINTSFSSSHELIKDKLDISAILNNPFSKFRTLETNTVGVNFTELSSNQSYLRAFKISLNYNFGKFKDGVKRAKRAIKNDDIAN